jgi:acyl-CoA dehydrogenase
MHQAQQALGAFIDNFPNRWVSLALRLIVFPLGRLERPPGDRLGHRVAQLLLAPSEARSRLTQGIYLSATSTHPVSVMESALPKVIAAEPMERKLHKAVRAGELTAHSWEGRLREAVDRGVLSDAEAASLQEVRTLVMDVIAVDEFDPDELRRAEHSADPLRRSNAA